MNVAASWRSVVRHRGVLDGRCGGHDLGERIVASFALSFAASRPSTIEASQTLKTDVRFARPSTIDQSAAPVPPRSTCRRACLTTFLPHRCAAAH
ncbi:hypothetical protein NOVOSPHI9U_310067 [Novosphingobium sp. 9U]|nr:hypothetical protein NOVOSPHI9U_310067 [Novosphingobium sp. 9U]